MSPTLTAEESRFNTSPSQDRNISRMGNTVNISSVNVYQFMDEAYKGTGGFRDGRYLIPFSRESNYDARRQLGHYKNYVKPIVRAMIEPVFSEEAIRSVKDEAGNDLDVPMFLGFLENVDAAGTSMQTFTHQATNICRRHGVVFIVMDNFSSTAQPATVAEALQSRIYPYIYIKKAQDVTEFKVDAFGNLVEIIFTDKSVKIGTKEHKRWRRWTQNESFLLGKSEDTKADWIVISQAYHGLGVVPVIMAYSEAREDKTTVLVDPPLYDLARINCVIYNQSAEIRDQERAQAFSIFYTQGLAPGDLSIGPTNYINIPMEASIAPGYASPNFAIIAGLVANEEQIRKDLFTIAEQAGVVGVENLQSGVSKAYDFYGHEETLKRTSYIATEIEEKIAEMFMLYTKETFVYTVLYPMDFQPMGLDREIARIDTVLKMPGLNATFAAKVQEKLVRMLMSDEDPTVVRTIIESIQAELTTAKDETATEDLNISEVVNS